MNAIDIQGIHKSYKEVSALIDLDFKVDKGELFGLIGPDGAGKTSLIRILTTLLTADKGTVSVLGMDVVKQYRDIRRVIGYMPGVFALYKDLTIAENLEFFATVFGTNIQENYELIRPIYEQIEPFKDRRAGNLSGGMKQKLALSCALIHRPEILFLDEPTTGVDAVSRKEFWDMLQDMKKHGITVFVSTPYMDEAILCERIALLQHGSIMEINTPQEIIRGFPGKLLRIKAQNKYALLKDLRTIEGIDKAYPYGEYTHVTFLSDLTIKEVHDLLSQKGHKDIVLEWTEPSIEDRFIDLMQKDKAE